MSAIDVQMHDPPVAIHPTKLYTVKELAEAMSVCEETIRVYIKGGKLTAFRLNPYKPRSPYRIKGADFTRFLMTLEQGY